MPTTRTTKNTTPSISTTESPFSHPSVLTTEIIAGVVVVVLLAIIITISIFFWKMKKKLDVVAYAVSLKSTRNPPEIPEWAKERYQPPDELQLEEELGRGAFGRVIKAKMKNIQKMVAVKTGQVGGQGFEQLNHEGQLLTKLEFHHNIINLLGTSMDFTDGGCRLLLILDFCGKGSLDKILKSKREEVQQKSELVETEDFNMTLATAWSYEIARGMQFLEDHSIIHGDLASRNILVDKDNTAKIADFGMAHRMDYDNIGVDVQGRQPVWWMAPEALRDQMVTLDSDKWSYGVTLWEIFSLGERPYSDRNINLMASFVTDLSDGYRMAQPERCPTKIYQKAILTCWDADPAKRPAWSHLIYILEKMVDSQYLHLYEITQDQERNNYIEIRNAGKKSINEDNDTYTTFIA